MIELPSAVSRGDDINADDLDQILAAVAELQQAVFKGANGAVGGGGTGGGDDPLARVLTAIAPDLYIPVVITAAPTPGVAALPSVVKYGGVGFRRSGITFTNKVPKYGRPVRNDECVVYPATVGMHALLVRAPKDDGTYQDDLMLLPGAEVRASKLCSTGALLASHGGGVHGMSDQVAAALQAMVQAEVARVLAAPAQRPVLLPPERPRPPEGLAVRVNPAQPVVRAPASTPVRLGAGEAGRAVGSGGAGGGDSSGVGPGGGGGST